jgi:alpha-tubulin suppressor-like RCC1 family protein
VLFADAGDAHSLFVTDDGGCLSCGGGHAGALGHGDRRDRMVPERLTRLPGHIVQASAGYKHSLFLSAEGRVYSTGSSASGQLGHGDSRRRLAPKRVQIDEIDRAGLRAVQVSAGGYHSLVVAEDGALLSWGRGKGGRLGHGRRITDVASPLRVEGLWRAGERVVQASAGGDHSVVLTEGGRVLSFGANKFGQCGYVSQEDFQLRPRRIEDVRA